jgi:hypothetical protein
VMHDISQGAGSQCLHLFGNGSLPTVNPIWILGFERTSSYGAEKGESVAE